MNIFFWGVAFSVIYLMQLPAHYSFISGITIAMFFNFTQEQKNTFSKLSKKILQISIILLGAKLDFGTLFELGERGIYLTFFSILFVFTIGHYISKLLRVSSPISVLISSGTSICGASAISAVAPVINAKSFELATAMGVVFILNAMAIFIFPPLAKFLDLTQVQFGTWAALAIHDTSSVVAASQLYGEKALQVATTLKLIRSLWIVPLVLFIAIKNKNKNKKINFPWFILGFISMSLMFSFFDFDFLNIYLSKISKFGLSITLFLIGLNFGKDQFKTIGHKPMFLGLSLWLITIVSSLIMVKYFIH